MIRKVWRGAILGEQACTKNLLGCNLNKSGHWLAATNLYQDKNDKRIFPNKMLRIWNVFCKFGCPDVKNTDSLKTSLIFRFMDSVPNLWKDEKMNFTDTTWIYSSSALIFC